MSSDNRHRNTHLLLVQIRYVLNINEHSSLVKKIKFIDYDYAKYGSSAERKRLISKWEKDVNSLPR